MAVTDVLEGIHEGEIQPSITTPFVAEG
jgi:hypothetical protein